MSSYKIQELIDEHKEDMNENLYLELCNKLMKLNKEENKEEQKVFKITYLEPYIQNTELNTFEIDMKRGKLYLPLTKEEHKQIKDRLDEFGHFTAHLFYHKMDESDKIIWSYTNSTIEDIECDCIGHCKEDCSLMTKTTNFKVKVWREIVKIEKYDNPER